MSSSQERRHKGERAKALLEDPLLRETLDNMRSDYQRQWAKSGFNQAEQREHWYRMLQAVEHFEKDLQVTVSDGQIAAAEIERDE